MAIVGAPNVGKSTLLNALVNEERALVSDIAGTTRDTVEDELRLGGVLFRLIDTAGIRDTADVVEGMGIERTYKTMDTAKVVIRLWSSDTELETISKDWAELKQTHGDKKCIGIINKTDLLRADKAEQLTQLTEAQPELLQMSAKNKEGVEQLKTALLDLVDTGALISQSAVVSNSRHYQALVRALEALDKVQEGVDAELSGDLLAIDLRVALFALGEITGAITNDDMLGHIFANFCIGK